MEMYTHKETKMSDSAFPKTFNATSGFSKLEYAAVHVLQGMVSNPLIYQAFLENFDTKTIDGSISMRKSMALEAMRFAKELDSHF